MKLLKCPVCGWVQQIDGDTERIWEFAQEHKLQVHPFTCNCGAEMKEVNHGIF